MARKAQPELDKQALVELTFTGDLEMLQPITAEAYEKGATQVLFERTDGNSDTVGGSGTLTVTLEGTANHVVSVAYELNRHHH